MTEHTPAPTSARSVYGFALYLGSYTLLFLYLVWAYIPLSWLHTIGLTYWPQKYWAIAVPVFCCCSIFVFAVLIYPGVNLIMTPDLSSVHTISDEYSRRPKASVVGSIPPIYDIPISDVCKMFYLKKSAHKRK